MLPRVRPTWFSAVHPKYRTPYRSILFLLPIALAFAFIADLNQAMREVAESLLCAIATDKLHSGPRARLDRELFAQGAGNVVAAGAVI